MCNGFPFELCGSIFHNSECANIAGAYSGNDRECKKAVTGVYDKGHYARNNAMGKIIKVCSLALKSGHNPPVDHELLNRRRLYFLGELLEFPEVNYGKEAVDFILNACRPVYTHNLILS